MNINNLDEFDKIKSIRIEIKQTVDKIKLRKHEVTKNYKEYIKKENDDFFGLDSFQSQIKLINLEYENMFKMYVFLENRIYGDYYKLLSMIIKYLISNLKNSKLIKLKEVENFDNYPKHKILEQFEKYDFNVINQIHHDIIMIIHGLNDIIKENSEDIKINEKKREIGVKIDNYINQYVYKNETLRTTTIFYNNYLQVYHKYHYELLTKFSEKVHLMLKHMTTDDKDMYNLEKSILIDKIKEKEIKDKEEEIKKAEYEKAEYEKANSIL